jgi:enamine deaminase RidA (YjgF/YER057c/UK114 family)
MKRGDAMQSTFFRKLLQAALAAAVALAFADSHVADAAPRAREVQRFFTPDATGATPADPFLANGVAVGGDNAVYTAAGTGPTALNTLAAAESPFQYIDYAILTQLYPDFAPSDADKAAGLLPGTMTITEAQGLNCMARVQENLAAAGLTLSDLTFMRIYVDNPADAARADYAGWNRAYRKYVANVDLQTNTVVDAYAPVLYENATRPARSNIEVATLPVLGWLIEIEVVAAYPRRY